VLKEEQVVITDNAGEHKVKKVKELIESKGAELVYLPPCSPELSPTEMCCSEVEQFLKKAEALNLITENDSEGWFGHCGYVI
jgi:transposase